MMNAPERSIPSKILIVRLSSIGDVVRTLPALTSLRREYPKAHIAWAVEDKSSGLLEGHPHLDEVIIFERKKLVGLLKNPLHIAKALSLLEQFRHTLRGGGYELVFDFHGTLKSGIVAALSRSPKRIGYEKDFVKEFNHLFTTVRINPADARLPRVARNLELIKPYVSPENLTDRAELGLPSEHRERAHEFIMETFGDDRPLVAVHPGTSRSLKKWFSPSFARLCDMLKESARANIMLTWGPGEIEDVKLIRSLSQSKPELGMETGSLLELAALFQRCALAITVDSGPMHIASAVGTPVVALFGPTDIQVNAPYWQPSKVVSSNRACSPCDEDCDYAVCMEEITPEAVCEAARELLEDV
jgi:lipopolysaccharide heptosyltransferase I